VAKSRDRVRKDGRSDAKFIIEGAPDSARRRSVAAGRGGEGGAMRRLLLRTGGIKKVEDTANCPVTEGDPKYEGNKDGEQQQK